MAGDSRTAAVESEIAHLRGLDLPGLRARWRSLTGRAAPAHLSKALLLRVLAYRVQAAAFGDLDKATTRLFDRIADEARSGAGSCIAHESPSGLGWPGGQAPKPQSGARSAGLDGPDKAQAIIRRES